MVNIKDLTWKDILGYHKAEKIEELKSFVDEGFHIISCDASYRDCVGTCSIQISNGGKEHTIKNKSFVAFGPNEAEIKSILFGIREAKNSKRIKKALFTNDNLQAVSFVTGSYTPQQENIKKALEKVKKELDELTVPYEFALVRSKVNRKVDRSAKKHLTKKEAEVKSNIEKRIKRVNLMKIRGQNLSCAKIGASNFIVSSSNSNKTYEVDLVNLSCTCESWCNNWGNKKEYIIFSRALPCKHMCKAVDTGNLDIFDVFNSQIFRRK